VRSCRSATTHHADALVAIEVPDELASEYLIAGSPGELAGGWREFCIPAHRANRYSHSVVEDSAR
jgi:hypothetical protein